MGPKYVIIKKGADGAELFGEGKKYFAPAYKINKVVDPTGAGDCFIAGIAGYLSEINEVSFESLKSVFPNNIQTLTFSPGFIGRLCHCSSKRVFLLPTSLLFNSIS